MKRSSIFSATDNAQCKQKKFFSGDVSLMLECFFFYDNIFFILFCAALFRQVIDLKQNQLFNSSYIAAAAAVF
jgi:hypothetical protein